MEKTLLERQVEALRVSIEPGGRWDRLASGEMRADEKQQECVLCELDSGCDKCPLEIASELGEGLCGGEYTAWKSRIFRLAEEKGATDFASVAAAPVSLLNHPTVVPLAREMKALLARLLVEYEAKLEEERKNA